MIPSDATNVSAEINTNPAHTGTFHTNDSTTALPKTTPFNSNDTIAAERTAERQPQGRRARLGKHHLQTAVAEM